MALRSFRERVLQTLAFEAGGLTLAAPLYAAVFDRGAGGSMLLVVMISAAVLVWTPIHNTLFDLADLHLANRVASDRPHRLRIVHAVSHEITAIALTLPIVMRIGEHDLLQGLTVNATLTAFYVGYAYVFHMGYDALRPVKPARVPLPPRASPRGPDFPPMRVP